MLLPSGAGGDVLRSLQRSSSADGLGSTNSNPNPKPRKGAKPNPYALTKKLNAKIQILASKLTEIMVLGRKVLEADLLLDSFS